ncbi:ABC transporter ATP-binding protein [Bacillus sp. S/N-304-OC-R1]|uniref:ABC transporter ATP-binding protein n=1 Tax=Bacillus sp. S/N-304-OC-R1 TaxID=2758034 RepID=UPI001C8EDBEC|nr:ABC transporter ATP-binding protein [Bacillus sp. S/N-304-OC-R1]MBY0120446.1 ABC transporter ATP-binding protein [Bacillus sp. S/N-304-OC-R1]
MTLELKNISYSYKKEELENSIITNLSFKVNQGEFVSLIGRSGTGKSTLLKLITGLIKQDKGEILINNKSITLGDVGYMPQRDLLLPWRTIIENIMISAEIQKNLQLSKEEARTWLERVGLQEYENALPKQLSGGMRQRVSFLRALLTGKELLLLDEPFGALDSLTKKEMQAWLLSIWQDLNKTVLFITHDLEEACFLSDRILLLYPNKKIEDITVHLNRPREISMLHNHELITLRQSLEKKIAYEKI